MRTALTVLTDELRRLKTSGMKSVSVSESSLAALRSVVRRSSAAVALGNAPAFASAVITRTSGQAAPKLKPSLLPPPPVLTLPEGDKAVRWAALFSAMSLDAVNVAHTPPGKKLVLGAGSLDAQIMFVADAPGPEDARETAKTEKNTSTHCTI